MTNLRRLSPALLLLALALAAGCSSSSPGGQDGPAICSQDTECVYGTYCDSGVCVPGVQPCAEFDACPDGMTCRNGTCVLSGQPDGGDGGDDQDGEDGEDGADQGPLGPDLEIVQPPLTGDPPLHQLDFGNVAVGLTVEQAIVVRNAGDQELRVLQLNLEAGAEDFAIPSAVTDALPLVLGPGDEASLQVTYSASDGVTDHGVLDIVSNDPDEALVKVHLLSEFKGEARAVLSTPALDFGDVPVGQSGGPLSVSLANQGTGNAVLAVSEVRAPARPDFVLKLVDANGDLAELPALLNQGEFLEAQVTYTPDAPGVDGDELVFSTDDPLAPSLRVPLAGRGAVGALSADPSPVVPGRVRVGAQATVRVNLSNEGDAALAIDSVSLQGVSAEWSLTSGSLDLPNLPTAPHVVPMGEMVWVELTFAPADVGFEAGELVATTSDPVGELRVALHAEGYEPAHVELVPEPAALAFGDVQLDQALGLHETRSLPLVLRSTGGDPLTVAAVARATGTTADYTWQPAAFAPVPSGQEVQLQISFAPTTAGIQNGSLLIDTNDPDVAVDGVVGRVAVSLSARGTDSLIFTTPASAHDFGAAAIGELRSATLSIRNASAYPLAVNEIRMGSGSSPAFGLQGVPVLPALIPDAGGEILVTMLYQPTAGGPASGAVEILSSDLGRPLVTITLQGQCQGCPAGLANCDADPDCETDTQTDPQNCGGCGVVCTAQHGDNPCVGGLCTPECDPLWGDCDNLPRNGCETPTNTLDDCSTCDVRCELPNAVESCSTGACTLTACDWGFHDCNASAGCETRTDNDPAHCGDCDTVCTNAHGGIACANSLCSPSCSSLWGSCDGDPIDGCETQLTSLSDCGFCGTPCGPLANATATCGTGTCAIESCNAGWCDLNNLPANGCEFDLDTNPACGSYTDIGDISGDEGAGRISYSGRGETWLRLYVMETYEDWSSCLYLSTIITLAPGLNTDYDLFAYCDGCSTVADSSSNGGTTLDQVELRWEEECVLGFPSGSDSSRYVYLQVRYYSGATCNPWSLEVYGNPAVATATCSEL
ncbi:MAG TPA: choice-of-anchor D domain-containing protein [Myxococcota bacterium]|nr:choice-of-anchor D domain-containing protein [Myxococcota bacterium]HRY95482.1 choice-of-anchor D domain-containing protein [Myxococcota bacterium]HSA22464.1 choice-of-anchor D domain-containing protein [Myxococcota bacterium]